MLLELVLLLLLLALGLTAFLAGRALPHAATGLVLAALLGALCWGLLQAGLPWWLVGGLGLTVATCWVGEARRTPRRAAKVRTGISHARAARENPV